MQTVVVTVKGALMPVLPTQRHGLWVTNLTIACHDMHQPIAAREAVSSEEAGVLTHSSQDCTGVTVFHLQMIADGHS
jgi:hypothetical protein